MAKPRRKSAQNGITSPKPVVLSLFHSPKYTRNRTSRKTLSIKMKVNQKESTRSYEVKITSIRVFLSTIVTHSYLPHIIPSYLRYEDNPPLLIDAQAIRASHVPQKAVPHGPRGLWLHFSSPPLEIWQNDAQYSLARSLSIAHWWDFFATDVCEWAITCMLDEVWLASIWILAKILAMNHQIGDIMIRGGRYE